MRLEASAFERVSSNSSPVSRHNVSRYERCASVIGSSPVFHSSGWRWSPGWSLSFVPWFLIAKMAEVQWLKPVLVGQFEFLEWTADNHLRHSKFVGLREDKKARDVVRE